MDRVARSPRPLAGRGRVARSKVGNSSRSGMELREDWECGFWGGEGVLEVITLWGPPSHFL